MELDGRDLPGGHVLEADVVVVGAGPAGITVATELADSGRDVLLVHNGGRDRADGDLDLAKGESVGTSTFPLHRSRILGFGGTAQHWSDNGWFRARPLDPIDVVPRPGFGHHVGWPLTYAELEPLWERAHRLCGLGPYDYDLSRWERDDLRALDLPEDVVRTVIFQMTPCGQWEAKYNQVVANPRITLLSHATVLRLRTARTGEEVVGLDVVGGREVALTVRPSVVVLAVGGIENPRLLLLSNGPEHPKGLGNAHDLVGRYFQDHLAVRAGTLRPADPDLMQRIGLYRQQSVADEGVVTHAKLSLSPKVLQTEGLLNSTSFVNRFSEQRASEATRSFVTLKRSLTWRPAPADLGGHARTVLSDPTAIAGTVLEEIRHRIRPGEPRDDVLQLMTMAEQAPHPMSRVRLGRRRDRFGRPVARLDWRIATQDRRSIERTQQILAEQLADAGIGRLRDTLGTESPPALIQAQWHHMGGTRMASDPTEGVVDADCRVHGVRNLYVAGSSIFPTSGYANPTLTIVAMALRLVSHLSRAS